ncbi:PAS domain S-box protein [Chloroflexota bacterium]
MTNNGRKTGIDIIGDRPWGTHFCQFYENKEDLIEILVPYFKAGLENNEFCMWITSEPLGVEEAEAFLRKAVKNLYKYIEKGQIEILDYSEWYTKSGEFDADRVLQGWVDKEKSALGKGFDGLRLTGNTFWLEHKDWDAFAEYENTIDNVIDSYRMLALCAYALEKCSTIDVLDVVSSHRFALVRKKGEWQVIRTIEQGRLQVALDSEVHNFRNSLDSSPLGIRIITAERELIYANQALLDIYGYSSLEELKKHACDTAFYAEGYSEFEERKEKRKRGEFVPSNYEISIVRKDGEVRHLSVSHGEVSWNGKGEFQSLYQDITESKQAEEALKESNEFATSLLENAPNPIAVIDRDTSLRYINPALEKLSGYSKAELIGSKPPFPFWPEEKREEYRSSFEQSMLSGISRYKLQYQKKSGELFWVDLTGVNISSDGQLKYRLTTWLDITASKQIEEALQESEERFRVASQIASDVVYERDLQTGIATFYGDIDSHLGYEPGGYPHTIEGWREHVHPEDLARIESQPMDQIQPGVPYGVEYRMRRKDGTYITWSDQIMMICNEETGKPIKFIGAATDITGSKQAEEKLRESEENFRNSLDNSPLGIRINALGGELLYANQAILDIYGYSSFEEMKAVSVQQRFTPESYAEHQERAEKRKLGNHIPFRYEVSIVRKDGEVRHMEVLRKEVIWNGARQFQGLCQDITERKLAEEAQRESHNQFETLLNSMGDAVFSVKMPERVIEWVNDGFKVFGYDADECIGKTTRFLYSCESEFLDFGNKLKKAMVAEEQIFYAEQLLIRKNGEVFPAEVTVTLHREKGKVDSITSIVRDMTEHKRLEEEQQKVERLESVGTLAGGIAHDFNNLLTGILGNISLAERHIEPKGKAAERLLEAKKASLRARDLTQQMLTFARGGAPIKKTVSMAELFEGLVAFVLGGSNVKCEFSLPDDLWPVDVDEGQMNQAITNLVINADEAMPQGGLLNIVAKNTVIRGKTVLPLPEGKYVEITMQDFGFGIAEEHLDRIFEPYFTTKQKGSGLGLATTYSIIKKHDGYITVKSELRAGTTFNIYLPASKKPLPKRKRKESMQPAFLGQGKILVMDDDKAITEMLSNMLSEGGYEVEVTRDGEEAIERYAKAKESGQPFDAVILDITIPGGMGGEEAIKKLLEIDPNVKAIVSSGYANAPIMAKFREYGFSAVATKPYSTGELERTLRRILRGVGK